MRELIEQQGAGVRVRRSPQAILAELRAGMGVPREEVLVDALRAAGYSAGRAAELAGSLLSEPA